MAATRLAARPLVSPLQAGRPLFEPLIRLRGVVKTYHTPVGDFHALRGVDVDLWPGEFVAVVGRSGSGKSTLANMLTGIDRPTAGTIAVDGIEIQSLGESDMARWRGRNLGIVFQFYQLLPMLSLLQNVMLPMDFCDMYPRSEREERALALLREVELEEMADKMPAAVSGGQQQSAAIARALANDAPIIVADEPTGNLDSRAAARIFALFQAQAERGKTILMVTHDADLAARAMRTIRIVDGSIRYDQGGA
jgi:putative ABC transport system ATP-binding protein